MEQIDMKTIIRHGTGNGPARRLRQKGKAPAVLYGPATDPILLAVDTSEMDRVLKKGSTGSLLLNLIIENGETRSKQAMIKEIQIHPVSRQILHVDFYEVDMNKKIRVPVHVTAKGTAKGVELGGFLQIIRRELEVLCFPGQIPQSIEIDVTDLDIGESVHVQEIKLEGDMEIPAEVNFTVLTVVAPTVEAGGETEAGEEAEGEENGEAES